MAKGKRGNSNRTPRRTSTRKSLRLMKGQHYDEHSQDFTTETDVAVENMSTLENLTPAIGRQLDTTNDIEERIASTGIDLDVTDDNNLSQDFPPSVDEEDTQFLCNLYELHDMQSCHFQSDLINLACFNKIDTVAVPVAVGSGDEVNDGDGTLDNLEMIDNVFEIDESTVNDGNNLEVAKKDECSVMSLKLGRKTQECDLLSKQLFQLNQQMKITSDRAKKLEDQNTYRSEVVRMEKLLGDKEMTIQNLRENINGKERELQRIYESEEDYKSKIYWLEKIIEERDNDLECMKEDNGSYKMQVKTLQEAIDKAKEKEIMQLKLKEDKFRAVEELQNNANEQLKENIRLQEIIEASKKETNELKEDQSRAVEKLQDDINDQLIENARLRTENTCLKNKEKVSQSGKSSENTLLKNCELKSDDGGCFATSLEMAETIVALTDAIESINSRLDNQEMGRRQAQNQSASTLTRPPAVQISPPPSLMIPPPTTSMIPPPPPSMIRPPPPPLPPPPIPPSILPPPILPPTPTAPKPRPNPPKPQHKTSILSSTLTSPKTSSPSKNKSQQPQTTMIISDSITTKINIHNIKNNINSSEELVIFKKFPGHTAEEIACYAPKPLSDLKPDNVVVVAGTNDISKAIYQEGSDVDEYQIVNDILEIARSARNHGAKKIFISSVLPRRGAQYKRIVAEVNDLLYMVCLAEEFVYMDHGGITLAHISHDGVHPNFWGTTILKFNILSTFRTFNRRNFDFMEDYEKSL